MKKRNSTKDQQNFEHIPDWSTNEVWTEFTELQLCWWAGCMKKKHKKARYSSHDCRILVKFALLLPSWMGFPRIPRTAFGFQIWYTVIPYPDLLLWEFFFWKVGLNVGQCTVYVCSVALMSCVADMSNQPSKLNFFLSGHLATDCSGLVASEKF